MNRVKLARAGVAIYFALFLVFVTWPGFILLNRPLPLVLGLPFNMAAIALWVAFAAVALLVLDRLEHGRAAEDRSARAESAPGAGRRRGGRDRGSSARGEAGS